MAAQTAARDFRAKIAARHEPAPAAIADAKHARNWSDDLAKMTRDNGQGTPSTYRTNAGRINNDAIALLAAIKGAPAADAFPAHVSNASMLPH
jgi:hypothetical protein